ncbi:unnamed protein product [Rotaria sordida]|uniref:Uncharacterized protein n=2 Tax=Rotaria sordida TaxID=392033 RepID=A0A815NUH9_9BILA|nr:unnamed protein product [Rotaria sordida]
MAHTGGDSFVKDSVITDDNETMIVGDDRRVMVDNNDPTIIRSKNKVLIPINNEPVLFAIKGFEAVNIQITERNIKSISQLPKIPRKKKESNEQQMELLKDVFKSTIAELFIEASKKTSKKKKNKTFVRHLLITTSPSEGTRQESTQKDFTSS